MIFCIYSTHTKEYGMAWLQRYKTGRGASHPVQEMNIVDTIIAYTS
jgi:hypothetical protein